MQKLLPPICMFLALAMLVAGFAVLAFGSPEASVELHAARAGGDEAFRDVLERDLTGRRSSRRVLIGLLFTGGALMAVMAFLTMKPSGS